MMDDIEFEDPIEEVYAVRRKISSRYGNNIRKIASSGKCDTAGRLMRAA